MKKIALWLKIIRPQTLFASVCPVIIGLYVSSDINWCVGLLTMFCALSLQIFSNLVNDYYDFVRGADKEGRVGPRRALAEGDVTQKDMQWAVITAGVVALLLGAALLVGIVVRQGVWACWPILLIGLTALLFAWLYTATDHSLSYLGIADIFVFLYYGVLASVGTTYLQTFQFSGKSFLLGAVCGLISMGVLMINNLRDMEDDRLVNKKTFPVRFGKRAGEIAMLVFVLLMPLFVYCALGCNTAMLIVLPALVLFGLVLRAKGPQYNLCLLFTGILNVLYVLMVIL